MLPVIDISRHQGSPYDFALARSRHVAGLIFRASHGLTVDSRFGEYVARSEDAGYTARDRGTYSFLNPSRTTGDVAARVWLDAVDRFMGSLDTMFMLDVETYWSGTDLGPLPVITGPRFAEWLRVCRDELEAAGVERRRIVFYSNASFWNVYVGSKAFGDHDVIVARYPTTKPPPVDARLWDEWVLTKYGQTKPPGVPMGWDTWDGWQFSAGGNRAGPTYGAPAGDLDLNIVRLEAWARWTTLDVEPAPVPPSPGLPSPIELAQLATAGREPMFIIANQDAAGGMDPVANRERWLFTGVGYRRFVDQRDADDMIAQKAVSNDLLHPVWWPAARFGQFRDLDRIDA